MDKQKEIREKTENEKMVDIIMGSQYNPMFDDAENIALALQYKGYGNVKQAVKEYVEKFKAELKAIEEISYYIGMYEFFEKQIDSLFERLYGEDL